MYNDTDEIVSLEELNWEEARMYFGFVAFIFVIFFPAVIGNAHILHVYIAKKKHNNTRVYVCFIAVLDMINCTVCYPYSIVNCLLPYMFYSNSACKLLTFITYATNCCVPMGLLVISIDRFRVICRPFGAQISKRMSKWLCAVAALVSVVLSSPTLYLSGVVPIKTRVPGIVGKECNSTGDNGMVPTVYVGTFSVLTIIGAFVLIILYSLMGLTVLRQQALLRKTGLDRHSTSRSNTEFADRRCRTLPRSFRPSCETEEDIKVYTDMHAPESHKTRNETVQRHRNHSKERKQRKKNVFFIEPEEKYSIVVKEKKRSNSFSGAYSQRPKSKIMNAKSLSLTLIKTPVESALKVTDIQLKVHQNGILFSPEKLTTTNQSAILKQHKDDSMQHQNGHIATTNSKTVNYHQSDRFHEHNNNNTIGESPKRARSVPQRFKKHSKRESVLSRFFHKRQMSDKDKMNKNKRTTLMFFWVTFVYLVSFLPNPALRVARYLNSDWYAELSLPELIVYNLFHGSVFLASASNFFIYMFCDSMFRREIYRWYKMVLCKRVCRCKDTS